VLLVGGFEASGRVGLLADAEAVRARGGVPLLVATSITAQGRSTFSWQPVHPLLVAAQIRAARELGPIHAVKLGVLPGVAQLRAVRRALRGLAVPWVVDPVVRASTGGRLSGLSPRAYLALAGARVWLTPNAIEAAWLLGSPPVRTATAAKEAAQALVGRGFGGALVKGGHLPGAAVVDILATSKGASTFRSARLRRGTEQRGTGCRLASALATELGRGTPPRLAVARARRVVRRHLRGAAGRLARTAAGVTGAR
jgi:hydroxymethylpyrimidine/phosphomethylpyrimidine kinase